MTKREPMTSDDLSPRQLDRLIFKVRSQLDYHTRMMERMHQRDFLKTDPLFGSVEKVCGTLLELLRRLEQLRTFP